MTAELKYSLVIPAFQEEPIIEATLIAVHDYLKDCGIFDLTEVIVVTADGNDKTALIVKNHASLFGRFQFIEPGMRAGKGRDVRAGIQAAKGDFILFTDADLATPVHHIRTAYHLLENGHDMVVGVRNLREIHSGLRRFVSMAGNMVARLLIAPRFSDTQCGFKGFRKDAAQQIFTKLTVMGWAFDMEAIFIARKRKLKIAALHIPDWSENKPEKDQLAGDNNITASLKSFKEVLRIRLNDLRGIYRRTDS